MRRSILYVLPVLTAVLVGASTPAYAGPRAGTVAVQGAVATPATYTADQLAALPHTTVDGVTGVLLTDLVGLSSPQWGTAKNPQLRGSVTVSGRWTVTLAYGELDPGFGAHPALLVGRTLVVPGDRPGLRTVPDVASITVGVSTAPAGTSPDLQVVTGRRTVTIKAATLARLPQRTRAVTYLAGTTPQTHTETGPSLAAVLLVAGVLPLPSTLVTAVGSDGYGAAVALAEDYVGGRPLVISLNEDGVALTRPRLVPDGDLKGGRYISDVVTLAVS